MEINQTVLDTIVLLPDQLWEAWEESRKVSVPENYKNIKRVLVCGMGGSALGGRVVKSLAFGSSNASIDVSTEYHLPSYANADTLVIVSSYSGNTEETISCMNEVIERNLPVFAVASGGKLVELAQSRNLPVYIVDPKFNPSGQPRMAVGYAIGAIFGILSTIEILDETDEEIKNVVDFLKSSQERLRNKAQEVSGVVQGLAPILVSSEHLVGATHVTKNQLNESAKSFSTAFDIPELNHHLMEGLKNPSDVTKKLVFIFFESALYNERVQKRYPLTKEVVEKNGIKTASVNLEGDSKIKQVFELISFGSYLQAFLGALYHEDPIAIPWVDYFKEKLS